MRKLFIFFISMFCLLPFSVIAIEETDIYSNEALLVNLKTDDVLFSKNTNSNAVPIASLTKLMTYAVVIDEIKDLENAKMVVPEGIVEKMINKGASRAGLVEGYEYSVIDLLHGLMIPSGCDAAEVLAINIGNGDSSEFVKKMNDKAKNLGMKNTYFIDSHGLGTLTEDNVSTEEDIYKLIKYVYKLPYFKQIISKEYYEIVGEKSGEKEYNNLRNTNYLMGEYNGGKYYIPYSIGGKTGNLNVAGRCLVTIAVKGDLEVVAITLGVPGHSGSSYDYHFTDNIMLLNYAFDNYTENITIDIGTEFRSLEIGKQHKIEATTSAETKVTWTSSNPEVATVDEYGIVTGISQGQVKITASTSSGNIDYTYVSVNCYNGVHVKYSTGPANQNGGWDPIDFKLLKDKGFDYVIIRAGYGSYTRDNTFYDNFNSAVNNEMNIGIWFEGYAENISEAEAEAKNIISILKEVEEFKEKINLPIFYNLFYSDASDPDVILEITSTFKTIVETEGYEVILELGKTKLSTIEPEKMEASGLELSIIYRSLPPNYEVTMSANEKNASFWNYKQNAYLGENLGTNAQLSVMYMNYKKINTNHLVYVPPVIEDEIVEKPEINEPVVDEEIVILPEINQPVITKPIKQNTVSNNKKETHSIEKIDMQEQETDKNEMKVETENNLAEKQTQSSEENSFNKIFYILPVIILLITVVCLIFVKNKSVLTK